MRRPQHGFSVSYQGVGTLMTLAVSTPTGVTIRDSHLTSLKGWWWATASVTWLTGRECGGCTASWLPVANPRDSFTKRKMKEGMGPQRWKCSKVMKRDDAGSENQIEKVLGMEQLIVGKLILPPADTVKTAYQHTQEKGGPIRERTHIRRALGDGSQHHRCHGQNARN